MTRDASKGAVTLPDDAINVNHQMLHRACDLNNAQKHMQPLIRLRGIT